MLYACCCHYFLPYYTALGSWHRWELLHLPTTDVSYCQHQMLPVMKLPKGPNGGCTTSGQGWNSPPYCTAGLHRSTLIHPATNYIGRIQHYMAVELKLTNCCYILPVVIISCFIAQVREELHTHLSTRTRLAAKCLQLQRLNISPAVICHLGRSTEAELRLPNCPDTDHSKLHIHIYACYHLLFAFICYCTSVCIGPKGYAMDTRLLRPAQQPTHLG